MKPFFKLTGLTLAALLSAGVCAQAQGQGQGQPQARPNSPASPAAPVGPAMSEGEQLYLVLLAELQARAGDPGAAYSLMMQAARGSQDAALYRRAVQLAFQARQLEPALAAARAWLQAHPNSREANYTVFRFMVGQNQLPQAMEFLKRDIALAPTEERNAVLSQVPRGLANAADKKQAATLAEQALADYLRGPPHAGAAWGAVGRLRLVAGDKAGALAAAERGQALDAGAEAPALLALELLENKQGAADALVRRHLEGKARPELRMAYARLLMDDQRYPEAMRQLKQVTQDRPDFAEAWLVQGALAVQDNRLDEAEAAVKRFLDLSRDAPASEMRQQGQAQAYLALAQIAEKRRDFVLADAWIDRIENAQDLVSAQTRRASILAQRGQLAQALELLAKLPERNAEQARTKLFAQVQLLRENKQYRRAFDLLGTQVARTPEDTELLYEQAMLAEKFDDVGEMERLLRRVMVIKPDYFHAYNALGYSLADRNLRLPEAKQLIEKALQLAPGNPFIVDSLGWVEFRLGNKQRALQLLEQAYKDRPDAEIAAHLGEVLWSLGQQERAKRLWREGLEQNADNETLNATLKRLRVRL